VQQGLPVIVVRNAWTMPQERYNAQWIRDNGLGLVLPSFKGVDAAAAALVAGLDGYREALARIDNRAVLEVPQILARILADAQNPADAPREWALSD
jgi:hypothetical protein